MDKNLVFILPFLVTIIFASFVQSSFSYQFIVGGKDGWVLNPSESYDQWAGRNRFSVNDTLLFKYVRGSNSVLVVKKDDFDKCNTGNFTLKMEDGNSIFKLDGSGPFYFISGNKDNCDKGQKLITVVLAVRNRPPQPPSTAAPPPNSWTPSSAPSSPPSPTTSPPNGTPSIAPSSHSPAEPPSNISPSPSPGQSPSPANHGFGPSPSAVSPEANPSPLNPSAGNTPAGGGSTPGGSATNRSFGAPACSPSLVLATVASFVLVNLEFGGFGLYI